MERALGIDHGTKGLRFCFLDDENPGFYEVERERAKKTSPLRLLEKKGFLDVELIGLSYSMADAITKITDIKKVKNRGQTQDVTGELIGGGTRLYDEILSSGIKAVLIPGLHRGIECLDDKFKLLYSHMAASEKVALAYHAYKAVNRERKVRDLIVCDISSNTVAVGIKDGRFFGGIDACLGSLGLVHGPLDLEQIRLIDARRTTANKAFYSSGISQKSGLRSEDIVKGGTQSEKLARKSLILAAKMEAVGFASEIKPQAIAIAGSAGLHENIFDRLKIELEDIAPVFRLEAFAAAIGAAEIARDILLGKRDFLGISAEL